MRKVIILTIFLSAFSGFSQTKELDSLSIQLAFETQDSLKVRTSLKLIKSLYEINDYDRALKYIIESEKLSNSLNFTKGIAETTYYKSLIYAQKGDYINAVTGYEKSKALFKHLNDTLGIAKVNNSIGLIEINRGNYSKGLQYSLAAIKELEKQKLKKDLSLAYSNLAKAYQSIHAVDKAIEFNLKAVDVQRQLNQTVALSQSYNQLAELYSSKDENRKAIEYYIKVLSAKTNDSDSLQALIYPKLGAEYLKFNDYEKATQYLIQGLSINRKSDNKVGILMSLNSLGELNLHTKRLILAENQLYEASIIAKSLNNKPELLKYYKLMMVLDSTKNKFDRAFIWQREYHNLKNSLYSNTNLKNADSVELDLNPNFEKELTTTTPQPPIKGSFYESKDEFNKFQLIFYGLLAALAIVSTFLILIYLKRSSNIKYTQELEEKNLKIELQNEAFSEQTKHLENVNNVKDKLFSIVSHDLKDSLSSINGFIDLLKDGSLSREEFDNLVPELSENANNASLLLFNLLNWSKSQMQSLEPKPTLFDIQEVFEDKVRLIEQRMENKGIELIDHSLRDFTYADRSMFEIVVQNLLANALKFCKNGDTITISNHISNGSCIVSIADTGIGISKENIEKLFKNSSFTTVGTNNEKGTGLGLSICKELIELNNGKIWVESTLNVGSTFYVQLPKSRPS
ncbi:tetratricopeptide repeat-containing sensor histidine kinase [Mariniflexile sp. AS56]|uniref:tetratricopeptide repeat-containing sensor histidine kinase n=1 Tax=Mariniflexile sp. AS56 TaxID=3063957 RepID=UPI0026F25750|nr:tetratricopeptide repeat-containing sensor histidine kinase [Mariniflexile sp. AS56]MDO7170709.1 tetratricopeptide repeat-containing sensor histidine kinase [Mariniflexile sp. AS56]